MPTLKGKAKAKNRKRKSADRRKKFEKYKKRMIAEIRLFDAPVLKEECLNIEYEAQSRPIIGDLGRILAVTDNGVGLAAPQIGRPKRIIALRPDGMGTDIYFMIHPEIVAHSEETRVGSEGCLSYPGIVTPIKRFKEITVEYLDKEFNQQRKSFSDFVAVVIQHEVDHLFGICRVGDVWREKQ